MSKKVNDFTIEVATVNGSGSQSSNNILIRSIFRMGIPIEGKNLFPSNIAGLPTWFSIRVNKEGYTSRTKHSQIFVAMNAKTIEEDVSRVEEGGIFIYNSDLKFDAEKLNPKNTNIPVSFKTLVKDVTDSVRLRKLLTNMVYVGILAELLNIESEALHSAVATQFKGKEKVVDSNLKAIEVGQNYAKENIKDEIPYALEPMNETQGKILIDGNTSGALGLTYGGCHFVSWYPITPSSSLAEGFIHYAGKYRKDENGKKTYAVVQAEDELGAISMVVGAGWAGARAMTTTSGPGISLMAEAAGLMYFAEIPGVIWDVQRAGPSTGLPTRTLQGDILSAAFLSHGDTRHILLLPGSPKECFEFAQTAFDVAERQQTLVFVLSDLDLGMNTWISEPFDYNSGEFDRGKVYYEEDLKKMTEFNRYEDVDGDGIPYRTLPGTKSDLAAYFTRGSGHAPSAAYSEDPDVFSGLLDRLRKKFDTAKKIVPKPIADTGHSQKVGIIAFGSTDSAIKETRALLKADGVETDYLRLRAWPFTEEVDQFINEHEEVLIVDQNQEGQMHHLLSIDYPEHYAKLKSVRHYNGLPVTALGLKEKMLEQLGGLK